jgi:hypothetical protein
MTAGQNYGCQGLKLHKLRRAWRSCDLADRGISLVALQYYMRKLVDRGAAIARSTQSALQMRVEVVDINDADSPI